MNVESIRELISSNPRTSVGYPKQVRDAVGRYAQRRRDDGLCWRELQAEVGVSSTAMSTWMNALGLAHFHQVVIVEDNPVEAVDQALVITTPSGFTLTGCTLEQAAMLLQRVR